MANLDPNTYYQNGQRMAPSSVDLDAVAQQMGYPDFATLQASDPRTATSLLYQYGDPSQGQFNTQVAPSDNLSTGRLLGLIGGAAGAGLVPGIGYLGGAGGAAAAGAPAAAGIAPISASVPTTVGLGGLTLPTASFAGAPALASTSVAAPISASEFVNASAPYTTQAGDIGGTASSGGIFSTLGKILKPIAGPIIGAATSIYGANKAAGAAKDAAALQAQSAKEALDFAKAQYADQYRQYEQQQANLGPYRDLGYSSLGALAGGLGLPEPAAPQTVPSTLMPPSFSALPSSSDPMGAFKNGSPFPPATPGVGGTLLPSTPTQSALAPRQSASSTVAQFAPYANPTSSTGTVYLKAPDGTVKAVDKGDVAHYLKQGATYV